MLKKLPTAAALSLGAVLAFAQEAPPAQPAAAPVVGSDAPRLAQTTGAPRSRPKPATSEAEAPVPEIIATPHPKKPGFFKRLFGRKPKETATPTPATTPTPTPRRGARTTAATPEPEKSTPAPRRSTRTTVATPEPEKPKATPAAKPPVTATASPVPAKTAAKATPKPKSIPEPPADADPVAKEKFRFEQAKAKASEDPQVQALKAKADNASTEEESRKALRAYNKALFDKIRKIDKSVAERATRLEAAILKRLNE